VASSRSLDELKNELDLPEVTPRSLEEDVACRDSGIVWSGSVHSQTPNDDEEVEDGDASKFRILLERENESPTYSELSNPSLSPGKISSTSDIEKILSTPVDTVGRSGDSQKSSASFDVDSKRLKPVGKPDNQTYPVYGNDEAPTTLTDGKKVPFSVTTTTANSELKIFKASPDVATSAAVSGTGERLSKCESPTLSKDSTDGQSSSTSEITDLFTSSISINVTSPVSLSWTVREQKLSFADSTDGADSSKTNFSSGGSQSHPISPKTLSVDYLRSPSTVERLSSTSVNKALQISSPAVLARTTSGNENSVPRRRVKNVDFLTANTKNTRPQKPPMFVRKLRNVSVVEGQTARFEVRGYQ